MNQSDQTSSPSTTGFNRRSFLRRAAMTAALATPAAAYLGSSRPADAALPYPPGIDLDHAILNFALNLEYLEANYYSLAVHGKTLAQSGVPVGGNAGGVTVRENPQVRFQTKAIQGYAHEVAADEVAHVRFVQDMITNTGGSAIVQPEIDLFNSFNAVAQAAGLGDSFDPFASEDHFLIGGFLFEDVGATAYAGAAHLLTNPTIITYAASILAVEGYHASLFRTKIYESTANIHNIADKFSNVRDSLDAVQPTDQGVVGPNGEPNIVPTGQNGLIFPRTFRAVANIVYGAKNATMGGFFPQGINGPIQPT